MLVSTPNRFRHALEKLAAEPPSTKTALMRSLLSEIEAALASGKTWKQVWQCLADDGLDISYETFRKLLQRVRKKARISAPRSGKTLELPGAYSQETVDGVARDPLVNLKRLEENRPGFHWRATPSLKRSDIEKGGSPKSK
jgi:predicted transcriptional regulator